MFNVMSVLSRFFCGSLLAKLCQFLPIILFVVFCKSVYAQDQSEIEGSVFFKIPEGKEYRFFTLTFQNDVFVNEDDGYTNGIGFTFGRGPFLSFTKDNIPNWLHWATKKSYIQTMPNKVRGVSYMFSQRMQTPEDITLSELQVNDSPYLGLATLQTTLYAWDKNVSDQLLVILGFVGPLTLAEPSQTFIHRLIDSDRPNGWDHQVNNEPVFMIEAKRISKLYRNYNRKLKFDVLGLAAAGFGNLKSAAKVGLAVRWGSSLEFSHATFSLQTDTQVNSLSLSDRNDFFVYAGARAGLVFNNIKTDGNTFSDSHSVPLDHYQNDASAGIVWKYKKFAYVFQLSSLSSRTTLTSRREKFGAFSFTYAY